MHYARVMVSLKGDVYVLEAEANSAVLEEHYRNYVLRSHLEKGLCIGEVFRSGVRVAWESAGLGSMSNVGIRRVQTCYIRAENWNVIRVW